VAPVPQVTLSFCTWGVAEQEVSTRGGGRKGDDLPRAARSGTILWADRFAGSRACAARGAAPRAWRKSGLQNDVLVQAAGAGDLKTFKRPIEGGVDPNSGRSGVAIGAGSSRSLANSGKALVCGGRSIRRTITRLATIAGRTSLVGAVLVMLQNRDVHEMHGSV
jgi:hypothetical protein